MQKNRKIKIGTIPEVSHRKTAAREKAEKHIGKPAEENCTAQIHRGKTLRFGKVNRARP